MVRTLRGVGGRDVRIPVVLLLHLSHRVPNRRSVSHQPKHEPTLHLRRSREAGDRRHNLCVRRTHLYFDWRTSLDAIAAALAQITTEAVRPPLNCPHSLVCPAAACPRIPPTSTQYLHGPARDLRGRDLAAARHSSFASHRPTPSLTVCAMLANSTPNERIGRCLTYMNQVRCVPSIVRD